MITEQDHKMPIQVDNIQLNRQHPIPLSRQLYVQLHQQVLHGQITFNERLPPTRSLATQLRLSRGVVVESYDMLKGDGLVAGFGKGGTRVCYRGRQRRTRSRSIVSSLPLARRGDEIAVARHYPDIAHEPLALTPGVPDFGLFPLSRWQSFSKQAMSNAPTWYVRDGGLPLLKNALRDYLAQYRGIVVNDSHCLLITSGSQASLSLLARMLAEPGESALLERPCWPGAEAAIRQAELNVTYTGVAADEGGSDNKWSGAIQRHRPRFVIVTPGMQFPTGRPMSMQEREVLLKSTARHRCWLIEDDYAAEYSYAQHPAPSIMAHSETGHVIHVGTMSKLLFPGLRIGWMVVPKHIATGVNNALNTCGILPPNMLQQQLGLFMQYGHLSAHLAHSRAIYNERRDRCSRYIAEYARELLVPTDSVSGMNLYFRINHKVVDVSNLQDRLVRAGLGCGLYIQRVAGKDENFLLLGHTCLSQDVVAAHLGRLVVTLSER